MNIFKCALQHFVGDSILISINLGKKLLRISSIRKFAVTWIFSRVFAQLTVLIISLIYSEWRDSENQQFRHPVSIFDWRKTNSVRFIPEIAPRCRWRCSRLRFVPVATTFPLFGKICPCSTSLWGSAGWPGPDLDLTWTWPDSLLINWQICRSSLHILVRAQHCQGSWLWSSMKEVYSSLLPACFNFICQGQWKVMKFSNWQLKLLSVTLQMLLIPCNVLIIIFNSWCAVGTQYHISLSL